MGLLWVLVLRLLYLHVDEVWFKSVKPALRKPPEGPREGSYGESLLVLVTVEEGDDESVAASAALDIASHASSLKVGRVVLYPYAHLSSRLARPGDAYRLLVDLERRVSEGFKGEVVRAPFGWYKAFGFKCKGHPLAELSRSFSPWSSGDTWQSWKKGWGEAGEVYERLGFTGVEGLEALTELKIALALRLGSDISNSYTAQLGPLEAIKICLSGRDLVVGPSPGYEVLGGSGGKEALAGFISWLFRESGLDEPSLDFDGEGIARINGMAVGGYRSNRACIGPLSSLVVSLISKGLEAAQVEGVTPRLPFWLTPLQFVFIPVGRGLSLASELHRWVKGLGGRSVMLVEGSLGSRVREAGRRWAQVVAVVGEREAETGTVMLRRRWEPGKQEAVTIDEFKEEALKLLSQSPSRRA